jgi:hypothetical protein
MTWINVSSYLSPVSINSDYTQTSNNPADVTISNNYETAASSTYKYLQQNINSYLDNTATSNIITISYNNNSSKTFYDTYNVYVKATGLFIRGGVDMGLISTTSSLTRTYTNLTSLTSRSIIYYRIV